jgi:hypothetical protein
MFLVGRDDGNGGATVVETAIIVGALAAGVGTAQAVSSRWRGKRG